MNKAVLSIGSNLGDRLAALQFAVRSVLDLPGISLIGASPVYETPPWGPVEQPDFLNAVLVVDVAEAVGPDALLHQLQRIESAHGRTRKVRWGPRTLDIDIVMFGPVERNMPDLVLPHPRAHERAFVLVPWVDVEPDAELPGRGSARTLLKSLDATLVRRLPGNIFVPED